MWTQNLQEILAGDIAQLVEEEAEESVTLEFKQQLPQGGDEDRREFLYDVAALANAAGGFLVFGIAEKRDAQGKPTGMAGEIVGLESPNLPSEIARLENIIRDSLAPRLTGIVSRTVFCQERPVLILSIPRSWNAPHMVTFKQSNKFYGRVASGKYPMSVDEIRRAFSQGAEFSDAIRIWRERRLDLVRSNRGPMELQPNPTMLFHIVPAPAFSQPSLTSTWLLSQDLRLKMHCPSVDFSGTGRYNGDGYLKWVDMAGSPSTGYTQVFRNGIVEYVTAGFSWGSSGQPSEKSDLFTVLLEKELIQGYRDAMKVYGELQITAPLYAAFSIFGIAGRRMYLGPRSFQALPAMRDDQVESSEVLIDQDQPMTSLKILADLMWQAGGLESTPSLNRDGVWDPFIDR